MATGTGNLPYSMSPVSPFDVITSQAENEKIANIESLADGTGRGDGSVTTTQLANAAVTTTQLANAAVTAPKIDFTTFGSYIKTGTANITYQNFGTSGSVVSIVFDTPFSGVPKSVVATPVGSTAYGLTIHVDSITATGFTAIGRINTGGPVSGKFNWVAVYS